MDIASTWDKAKNGVRNGGAGWPRVARSGQHSQSDRHHLDPTFDQVEGNSEKMQRGCTEKGLDDLPKDDYTVIRDAIDSIGKKKDEEGKKNR